jgi:hypothetical protein
MWCGAHDLCKRKAAHQSSGAGADNSVWLTMAKAFPATDAMRAWTPLATCAYSTVSCRVAFRRQSRPLPFNISVGSDRALQPRSALSVRPVSPVYASHARSRRWHHLCAPSGLARHYRHWIPSVHSTRLKLAVEVLGHRWPSVATGTRSTSVHIACSHFFCLVDDGCCRYS